MKALQKFCFILALAVIVAVAVSTPAGASIGSTTFTGTVTDHDGHPLPSGSITIALVDSGMNQITSGSGAIGSGGQFTVTISNFDDSYAQISYAVTYNSATSTQWYGPGRLSGNTYTGVSIQCSDLYVPTATPTPSPIAFNANVRDYNSGAEPHNPVGGAVVKVQYGGNLISQITDASGNAVFSIPFSSGNLEAWVEYTGTAYASSTYTNPAAGDTINKNWLIDLPAGTSTPVPSDTYVITGHLTANTAGTPVTVSTTYGGGGTATTDGSGNYRLTLLKSTGSVVLHAEQDCQGWTIARDATIASPNLAAGSDTQDFDFFTTLGFMYDFQGTTYVNGVRTNGVHVSTDVSGINTYDSKNYGGNSGFYHIRVGTSDTAMPVVITATYGGISKQYTLNTPTRITSGINSMDIYLMTGAGATITPPSPTPGGNSTPIPAATNNSTATIGNQTANVSLTPTFQPTSTQQPNGTATIAPSDKPTPAPSGTSFPWVWLIAALVILAIVGGSALLYLRKK